VRIDRKLHAYVQKVGSGVLFSPCAENVLVGNAYRLKTQGLSTGMYEFSVRYVLRGKNLQDTFILRMCRAGGEKNLDIEYSSLRALKMLGIPVPAVFTLERDKRTMGSPFIIMEKISGRSASYFLRDERNAVATIDILARTLASIHQLCPPDLSCYGKLEERSVTASHSLKDLRKLVDLTYITSLSPVSHRKYVDAIRKLEKVEIKHSSPVLVHGDFNPSHVLITERGPIIVDWGDVGLGDPAYDVGYMYHMLLFEGRNVVSVDLQEKFVERYYRYRGRKLDNFEFYQELAALRLIVLFDLYLRPGFYSIARNLLIMAARELLTRTLYMRTDLRSFQNYCIKFLRNRGVLTR
jgi:aminoglycoside phosphotransferase (APT) family kinase protein